jgi:hypothetical protein
MNKLNDNLTKTNAKLTNAKEKMHNATTKRDTAVSEKKTAMSNLATKESAHKNVVKELLDAKKELANAGTKDVENLTRQLQQADFWVSRGDSVERYPEKERIKLAAFEEKKSSGFRSSPGHAALGEAICIAPAHRRGHQTSRPMKYTCSPLPTFSLTLFVANNHVMVN